MAAPKMRTGLADILLCIARLTVGPHSRAEGDSETTVEKCWRIRACFPRGSWRRRCSPRRSNRGIVQRVQIPRSAKCAYPFLTPSSRAVDELPCSGTGASDSRGRVSLAVGPRDKASKWVKLITPPRRCHSSNDARPRQPSALQDGVKRCRSRERPREPGTSLDRPHLVRVSRNRLPPVFPATSLRSCPGPLGSCVPGIHLGYQSASSPGRARLFEMGVPQLSRADPAHRTSI